MLNFLGVANVRTHTKNYVVNKVSRYQRTAGLDEQSNRQVNNIGHDNGYRDMSSNTLINTPTNLSNGHANNYSNATRTKRMNNECVFATALTSIRQPTDNFVSGLSVPFNMDSVCLAATFGTSRGFLNPEEMSNQQDYTPRACSSLYVISWHGRLIEYVLEPIPGRIDLIVIFYVHSPLSDTSKHGTRVTPETPLVLKASPKAQWLLQR